MPACWLRCSGSVPQQPGWHEEAFTSAGKKGVKQTRRLSTRVECWIEGRTDLTWELPWLYPDLALHAAKEEALHPAAIAHIVRGWITYSVLCTLCYSNEIQTLFFAYGHQVCRFPTRGTVRQDLQATLQSRQGARLVDTLYPHPASVRPLQCQ